MCAQIFHTMYHSDENVLLGAPTGSGKTISAELAILHCFTAHPGRKVIYIAPLKVLLAAGSLSGSRLARTEILFVYVSSAYPAAVIWLLLNPSALDPTTP